MYSFFSSDKHPYGNQPDCFGLFLLCLFHQIEELAKYGCPFQGFSFNPKSINKEIRIRLVGIRRIYHGFKNRTGPAGSTGDRSSIRSDSLKKSKFKKNRPKTGNRRFDHKNREPERLNWFWPGSTNHKTTPFSLTVSVSHSHSHSHGLHSSKKSRISISYKEHQLH